MQNESPLLRDLRNYYDEVGILSTNFRCPHECECRGKLPLTPECATTPEAAEGSFTRAKSAQVGKRYGEAGARLLFASSDPGAAVYRGGGPGFASDESRTPLGVQNQSRTTAEDLRISDHWNWTHKLACMILDLRLPAAEDATPHFAHINAAKCTVNNPNNEEAGNALFKNCRKYMLGEIRILKPDIIVTQGGKAEQGMGLAFRKAEVRELGKHIWTVEWENRWSIWWHTYHPSSYGAWRFNRQMEGSDDGPGLDGYIGMIRDFIRERVSS